MYTTSNNVNINISDIKNFKEYKIGSIISLNLVNFQTYDKGKFNFHPRLNFIAGPNGSGKSSITNAFAFVFGGSTKVIGKARDIMEYVKSGRTYGTVEVVLKKSESEIVTIKRCLKSVTNTSTWFVNGRSVQKTDILGLVESLKIDVGNLLNFLPQERVSEFSKYSSEELLTKILECQKDKMLLQIKSSIEELEKNQMIYEKNISNIEKDKIGVERVVTHMSNDIKKIKEREEKKKRVRLMKIKKESILLNDEQNKYLALKKTLTETQKEIEECKEKVVKGEEKVKILSENETIKKRNLLMEQMRGENSKLKELKVKIENIRNEEELIQRELKNFKKIEEDEIRRINEKEQKIKQNEEKIKNFKIKTIDETAYPSRSELDRMEEKAADKSREMESIKKSSEGLQDEMLKLMKAKTHIDDEDTRRLNQLKKYHTDTFNALMWLRSNKRIFEDEIIEPAFMTVALSDERFCDEVEGFLNFQMLSSFLCKNKRDFEKFMSLCKDKFKFGINAMEISLKKEDPNVSREEIKRLGFDGYLIDFISGREEVINFLESFGKFNKIPVSKRSNIDENYIFKNYDFQKICLDKKYVEIRRSRHNKNDYTIISSRLPKQHIFNRGMSQMELSSIKAQLTEKQKQKEENQKRLETKIKEYAEIKGSLGIIYKKLTEKRKLLEEIKGAKEEKKLLNEEIMDMKKQIEESKQYQVALLKKEEELKEREREKINHKRSAITEILGELKKQKVYGIMRENRKCEEEMNAILQEIDSLKLEIKEASFAIEDLQKVVENTKVAIEKVKSSLTEKKKDYRTLTITEEDKNAMKNLPDNLDALNKEIASEKAILAFHTDQGDILREYEKKENLLKNLNQSKESLEEKKKKLDEEISKEKAVLIEEIKKIVEPVNVRLMDYFKRLDYEGMVKFEHENLRVYEYKLVIYTKFRENEEFQPLCSFRQSGGEKSVSTILFLLSLFDSTTSPFRLVDEINQGMDMHNERKVHNLLVTLTKEEAPQFFIITPKIIDNLTFPENMKVIIICMVKHEDKQLQEKFDRYKSKVLEESLKNY